MKKEINKDDKLIVVFMGFIHHTTVDIDDSDCGGIYTKTKIWSKIPIEVDGYPDDKQFYLKEDWKHEDDEVIYGDLKYSSSWDWLMKVITKLQKECDTDVRMTQYYTQVLSLRYDKAHFLQQYDNDKLKTTYAAVVEFIKWWNREKKS